MRSLDFSFFSVNLKKYLLLGLAVMVFVVSTKAEEPVYNFVEAQKELQNLELKLQNAILEIDNKEKKMVQKHLDVCKSIEMQLKDADDKKPGSKLSKKERKALLQKMVIEYQTIDMIKQLNMLTRDTRKKEFEKSAKDFFAKHDVYLSNQ